MKISIKLKDIKEWLKAKERLMGVLGTAPVMVAAMISGSCAAGCPYGLVNDPYPGQCPRYIDANGDGICDLSQTATTTETDSDTSTSSTDSSAEDTQTATTDSPGNPDKGADQSTDTGAADPSNVTNASNVTSADDNGGFDLGDLLGDGGTGYHVIPLTMLIVGAYLFTHYLFTKGVLTPKRHKRIWNLLVTGGYLGTGVTGVLLIFMIKLGITALRQPTTFWHVELAVLMVIGTLIHIHIYRKPFKNMFKVLFGLGSSNTKNSRRDMRSSK